MINKVTAQVLTNRLPLALLYLKPEIVSMLEWKWGEHDGLFHSVKATIKQFPEFKETDITTAENQAMDFIEKVLSDIYRCSACGIDLRKSGMLRKRGGVEIAEFYLTEDGKQSRIHHDKFDASGKTTYNCLLCQHLISDASAVGLFLKNGINKNVCIDYLYRFHSSVMKNVEKNNKKTEKFDYKPHFRFAPDDVVQNNNQPFIRNGEQILGGIRFRNDEEMLELMRQEEAELMRLEELHREERNRNNGVNAQVGEVVADIPGRILGEVLD